MKDIKIEEASFFPKPNSYFKEVVLAILETDLDNEECAEIITFIADGYFERTDE